MSDCSARWIPAIRSVVDAVKASKEYVYDVANVCKTCEHKNRVFKWVRAEDDDIQAILKEIKRGYRLALNKCLGPRLVQQIERRGMASVFAAMRSFERTLPRQRWSVDKTRPFGASVIRDMESGKLYYIYGWDGLHAPSSSGVKRKLSLKSVRGKEVDYKVLIARRFSRVAKELVKKARNVVLIDMGFLEEGERTDVTLHGGLDARDPLISLFLPFLESFRGAAPGVERELEALRERYASGEISFEEYKAQRRRIEGITSFPEPRVDRFVVDGVVRAFKEYYRVTDCGHLHIAEREPRFAPSYAKEEVPFEERLKDVGLGLGLYPSKEEAKERLNELKGVYEELLAKIDKLHRSELVTTVVRKDVAGNLYRNEVRFLCKTCEESFINRLEMNPPCRGRNCVFKHFVVKLAEQMQCNSRYVDVYDFGILEGKNGNIIVSQGRLNQPPKNISMFDPKLILCVHKFFFNKLASRRHYIERGYPIERPVVRWEEMEIDNAAFVSAMDYLTSAVAYDCEDDRHAYVPVGSLKASTAKIVKKLASIEYTVKPTERAYRAAHDRIAEICKNTGLEFGFKPTSEYRLGPDRIDVAWLNGDTGALEVAIEVELSASVTGDLWKLCEARPKLAVLIVKGGYYKSALDHAARSEIIKKTGQRLMVLDISEKAYVVVKGGRLLMPLRRESG